MFRWNAQEKGSVLLSFIYFYKELNYVGRLQSCDYWNGRFQVHVEEGEEEI